MLKIIKKYKELTAMLISFASTIILVYSMYSNFMNTLEKTQQLALKGVIWNNNIPIVERTELCDDYIELGFNSYTKKYCELILSKATISKDDLNIEGD